MTKLNIADELELPTSSITQTFGVLAVRGAGKSNLAAVMAEEMHAAKLPFVVVDPVGAWWGLRSSADGKGAGLSIPIFGGRHGDVPLEKTGGQLIADLVVDERLSCVLDVSVLSEGDKIRFLIDFAERLYRRNEDPLHLFLEEADDYAPQRPMREQARLLRAWENIVRRGRARGLGITMVTQRSAALNKNVLTQIETLFVLRTTSPQDRKAIQGWVDYHGESREILDSLPSLEAGEAWVWSPSWLKACKRIQVRRRSTFDSGATPKDVRGRRPPATVADVDLGAIKDQMAATIERAKAEDPRELRREIAALKRELGSRPAAQKPVERVEVPALKASQIKRLEALAERLDRRAEDAKKIAGITLRAASDLAGALIQWKLTQQPGAPTPGRSPIPAPVAPSPAPRQASGNGDGRLTGPEQRILDALAWLDTIAPGEHEQTAVAFLAGYTVGGGAFNNPRGALRSKGLIDYRGERLALTELGQQHANLPGDPLTTEELHARVLDRLPGPETKILRVLLDRYPRGLSNEDLATAAGYKIGGAYNNPRGRLRSLGLIEYRGGEVVARPVLFLEGSA